MPRLLRKRTARSRRVSLRWPLRVLALLATRGLAGCGSGADGRVRAGRLWPGLMWGAVAPLFVGLRGLRPLSAGGWAGVYGWWTWGSSTWRLHAPLREILGLPMTGHCAHIGGWSVAGAAYALAGAAAAWAGRGGAGGGRHREAAIFTLALYWLAPVFDGNYAHAVSFPAVFKWWNWAAHRCCCS